MPPRVKKDLASSVPYLIGVIAVILSVYVLYVGKSILVPLLIALFIAYLVLPLVNLFKKLRLPSVVSIFFILIFFFGILSLLGYTIYENVQDFILAYDKYEARFSGMISSIDGWLLQHFNIVYNPIDVLKTLAEKVDIPELLSTGVGTISNFFSTLVLIFFYLIFILMERKMMKPKIDKIIDHGKSKTETVSTITTINEQIQKYITLKTIISLSTSLLVYAALKIIGVDFAELWAMITFFLNYIPNVGSILATIPPILLALVQFGSFWQAMIVAAILISIQTIIGNIVEPKIFGRQLNLSPLVVFFSLIFWGTIWGVIGMILSVPIMAALSIITWHIPSLRPISILMREKG
ncbi:AI-2E family transporter [Patescibacteria group bacterium]|nr:AI-2E family transporter [Patescibacteria group bacterium]